MIYLFGGLGVVILLLGLAVGFEHERAVSANNRADAAELKVKAALDQAQAIAALWRADAQRIEAENMKAKELASAEINDLKARIAKAPTRPLVFDAATAGLFGDITAAANAAQPPAVDQPTPNPLPATAEALYDEREVTVWLADAAKAYRDARQKWQSCVDFYGALQKGAMQ